MTIENIIRNPSLQLLVGGMEVWAKPLLPTLLLNIILNINLNVLLLDGPACFSLVSIVDRSLCHVIETLLRMLNIICKMKT